MAKEQLSRDEAIQYLTMQRDLAEEAMTDAYHFKSVLLETGDKIGYAPAMRCLVKGLTPEESIRWNR